MGGGGVTCFLPGTIRLPYNPNVHEEYWIVMLCAFRIFKCLGEYILCTGWPIVLNFDTVFMFRSISYTECFCLFSFLTSSALILDNEKHNVIILLVFFTLKDPRCFHNVEVYSVRISNVIKNNMFRNFVWYGSVLGSYNVSGFVILHILFCQIFTFFCNSYTFFL